MTNIPATQWVPHPQGLEGEYNLDGGNFIVDPSGNFLVDPSGNFIVDPPSSFTPICNTVWAVDNSNE